MSTISPPGEVVPVAGLLIGDSLLDVGQEGVYEHVNPATGRVQVDVPLAGAGDVDLAVAAARAASPGWRDWRPVERRRVLYKLASLIAEDGETLALLSALEAGIPVSVRSARFCSDWLEHAAGWADRLEGQVVPTDPARILDYTLPEPYGVVAVILTWNSPLSSIGMTVGPPLAAGCCVVLKPSELAPFTAVRFGQLCLEAGLPPGVVNVLPGGTAAGRALVEHPDVEKVSFTGGTSTARSIAQACGAQLKPCLLELGGKSACLVFADADLVAALGTVARVIGLAGQGCTHPTRLLVHDAIYDQLMASIATLYDSVTVGDPLDQATKMGPVITESACTRILDMIGRGREAGFPVLAGGYRMSDELANGYYLRPTLIGDVAPEAEIAQEEVFGPVLAVTRFHDEDEAVAMANSTKYGLAAYLHTTDLSRAHRVARRLDAGSVGVNGGGVPGGPAAPFGGIKASGYGVEGGLAGVREFLRYKNVEIHLRPK